MSDQFFDAADGDGANIFGLEFEFGAQIFAALRWVRGR